MTEFPKTSLLISTYNWPRALELCLKSVFYQIHMPDEILIADDGSTKDTKELIDSYRPLINVPIKHIWHEDQGFRKTLILNEAIRQGSHEYIIQTDGDIILHPNFIMDHLINSRARISRLLVKFRIYFIQQQIFNRRSEGLQFFFLEKRLHQCKWI